MYVHGTREPDLGFGDIWHNMISKLNIGKSIGCYSNLRKADILSISSHPCQYKTFLRNLTTEQI